MLPRIEPELLRRTRFLLTGATTADEVDLWFSPLIESRTSDGVVFIAEVAELLRQELGEHPLFEKVWHLLQRSHREAPWSIRLEEWINYLSIKNNGTELEHQKDKIFAAIEQELISKPHPNHLHIGRWLVRALETLPQGMKNSTRYRKLKGGVSLLLYRRPDFGDGIIGVDAEDGWIRALIKRLPTVTVGVRLLEGAFQVGPTDLPGAQSLELPHTEPLVLELRWREGGDVRKYLFQFSTSELPHTLESSVTDLEIVILGGARYRLKAKQVEAEKSCFVIQGFGEKTDFTTGRKLNLDASYQVIKEAVEAAGLECLRADEIKHSLAIDLPLYEWLLNADLVIADLSTYNINAAYELGVRYGLRRQATIIVAEEQFANPFDVSHLVIRRYKHLGKDLSNQEARRFKQELKAAITEILATQKVDSPVYTFLPQLQPPLMQSGPLQTGQPAEAAMTPGPEVPPEPLPDQSAKQLLELARNAMAQSNFIGAKSLFQALRQLRPNDHYVIQQLALATYKNKFPDPKTALDEACDFLKTLNPDTTNDPETLGLFGSAYKQLWELTRDRSKLEIAITTYERGFYLKQDYYNGINLAFLFNVRAALEEKVGNTAEAIADFVQARRVRREVISLCNAALATDDKSADDKYWIAATLWEAAVGLKDAAEIAKYKPQAEAAATAEWMLETTRAQIAKLEGLLAAAPLKHLSG